MESAAEEMTARVLSNIFTIEHNRLAVARQEFEAASAHYDDVLSQDWTSDEAQSRFRAASDRRTEPREAYIRAMDEHG
jgi:hypothetical protein